MENNMLNIIIENIGKNLLEKNLKLVTAESCTTGLIAATLSDIAGSYKWLEGGFVVHTPDAKHHFLSVNYNTIEKYGMTSEEVAYEMAYGALENSYLANLAIAVTSLSGNTVCIAWARVNEEHIQVITEKCYFEGNRNEIREKIVQYSLKKLNQLVQ